MKSETITLTPGTAVVISKVGGDLVVQGWNQPELQVRGDAPNLEQGEGSVQVTSRGDLVVSVPREAPVEISTVGGDASIRDLSGPVRLGVVGGDAALKNLTGAVALIGPVGGDMRLDSVIQVSVSGGQGKIDRDHGKWERQQRRMEERIRHAERKVERARSRGGVDFGSWLGRRRWGAAADQGADEAASEEERMAVLKMLQEKKITSEQADKLLMALEGEKEGPPAGEVPTEGAGS